MGRLRTLAPRVAACDLRRVKAMVTADHRVTGRALQARRQRLWKQNPNCAGCGCMTVYPYGFELDHRIPLYQGGEDTEANCQILCNGPDGCHLAKTREDMK
jgi:5-methylcytosine-specific restriction protein A